MVYAGKAVDCRIEEVVKCHLLFELFKINYSIPTEDLLLKSSLVLMVFFGGVFKLMNKQTTSLLGLFSSHLLRTHQKKVRILRSHLPNYPLKCL
jgi:hypothetical protein